MSSTVTGGIDPGGVLTQGVSRIFHWGLDRTLKAESGGGVLGEGAATPSPPARRSGERCELPQQCLGRSSKVFHCFQHSGWPLLTL